MQYFQSCDSTGLIAYLKYMNVNEFQEYLESFGLKSSSVASLIQKCQTHKEDTYKIQYNEKFEFTCDVYCTVYYEHNRYNSLVEVVFRLNNVDSFKVNSAKRPNTRLNMYRPKIPDGNQRYVLKRKLFYRFVDTEDDEK